ncbi:MAG: hypothetical protein UHD09_02900 [Bifidobacterium sp.]|nr:hypothetical protein [Bifidobacterium sp.]
MQEQETHAKHRRHAWVWAVVAVVAAVLAIIAVVAFGLPWPADTAHATVQVKAGGVLTSQELDSLATVAKARMAGERGCRLERLDIQHDTYYLDEDTRTNGAGSQDGQTPVMGAAKRYGADRIADAHVDYTCGTWYGRLAHSDASTGTDLSRDLLYAYAPQAANAQDGWVFIQERTGA